MGEDVLIFAVRTTGAVLIVSWAERRCSLCSSASLSCSLLAERRMEAQRRAAWRRFAAEAAASAAVAAAAAGLLLILWMVVAFRPGATAEN